MKLFRFILFIIILFKSYISHEQNKISSLKKRCQVNTFNFEKGLLNNSTTDIITDLSGFTWVSTKTGLQRFNGYILETIKPVVNYDTLNINYPVNFFVLKNGLIWISFKKGVLEYDPGNNSFRQIISYHSTDPLYYSIVPLKETTDGIWCMQENKGIVIYSRSGAFKHQYSFFDPVMINAILKFKQYQYSNSIGNNDNYIFLNSIATKSILRINFLSKTSDQINSDNKNILSLACYHNNLYLLSDSGLFCLNTDNLKKTEYFNLGRIINEKIKTGCLSLSGKNQLLLSVNNHLFELDTDCVYHSEITDLNRNSVVGTGTIFKIYSDQFRRIWLLTNNDIKRIQNTEIAFDHFIYPVDKSNFVRAIYFDEHKNYLFAGCFNEGIQLYDTTANPLWKRSLKTTDVKDIIAIEKLTDDEYLLITFERGWYLLKLSTLQIKPFNFNSDVKEKIQSLNSNYCNNIQRINETTLLIATANNIFRCVFYKTKLLSAESLLHFNTYNSIECFLYSTDKTIWAGTSSGMLYRLDQTGYLKIIDIPDNYLVRSIAEDIQHNIWVGTDKGLYIYNNYGVFLKKITMGTGLLNDCIYSILPMTEIPAVFASSNMGLSYITLDGTIKNFSREFGLQENEFNTESALKTKNGKFYFGGINGISAFYPSALSEVKDSAVLNITRLMINDSLYNFSQASWRNDSIILDYKHNHLELDIAALGLLNTDEYEYQYRLKSFDKNWQKTHHPTGIKYVLPPGNYMFEITCSPLFSSSDYFKKTITIIISPPWWQAWWFRIAVIVTAIAIIVLILQQYNSRKYQKKIRLLQIQQEIQQERERISRDLHDNLGAYAASIASNIDHITIANNVDAREAALKELRSNSQSIVSQLGDTIWALKKDALSLTAISDRIKIFMQKVQKSYPAIKIALSEKINQDHVLPPSQAFDLLQIVQEAITNAVRHSKCNHIILNIDGNKDWKISISDDGTGMPSGTDIVFEGNGLANMKSRTIETGWVINWGKNTPNGTRVIITSSTTN